MLIVRKEHANKGVVVSIRSSAYRMKRINLDTADQKQLEAIKEAGLDYVTVVKKKPPKK